MPWSMQLPIPSTMGQVDALTFIQGTYDNPGNLEGIARIGDGLAYFYSTNYGTPPRSDTLTWHGPYPLAIENSINNQCSRERVNGISGNPVLIQSTFGNNRNFELVVPRANGGFNHYFRDNDDIYCLSAHQGVVPKPPPPLPWKLGQEVTNIDGHELGHIDAISLIQSDFAAPPGNLEVVARMADGLVSFWSTGSYLPHTNNFTWNGPLAVSVAGVPVSRISGNPVLIQSKRGRNHRNFELVVPRVDHGFNHYYRDNDDEHYPWKLGQEVTNIDGHELRHIDAISLIQGSYPNGNPGNLEVVARMGDELFHFFLDSVWHGPFKFVVILRMRKGRRRYI
jgi:hypothetical protein